MKLDKAFFEKYSLTICAAISLISLFLPFIKTEVSSEFVNDTQTFNLISGISEGGWIGIALIVCPILVIAMSYIKQLDNYKGIIVIAAPIVCIIGLIADFFLIKSASGALNSSMDSINGAFGTEGLVDSEMSVGFGFFIALISYIAMLVCGAMIFHGLKLSKEGIKQFADNTISNIDSDKINELKDNSIQKLSQLKDTAASKVSSAVESVKETASNLAENHTNASAQESDGSAPVAAPIKKKKPSSSDIDNTLSLIERLSEMKEKGILTQEEFDEKKKELLENI